MGASQRQQVADSLRSWIAAGAPAVLATVVASTDSAPRGIGAQLAVTRDGLWTGAISGGCAEVSVLHTAAELIDGDDAARARIVTLTRDELGSAGPVCGATLTVIVERVDDTLLQALIAAARPEEPVSLRREWRRHADVPGELVRTSCDVEPRSDDGLQRTVIEFVHHHRDDHVLIEHVAPAPRIVIGGAGDVAAELIRQAHALGWRSTLVDPRRAFVAQTVERAQPDDVIEAWPDERIAELLALDSRCACVAAAHDERIDTPFLLRSLASDAFYVGSIGSRVVQHERRIALAAVIGEDALRRHHGPAGLNLGGGDAAEIALSIMAEAVASLYGRPGTRLTETTDAIRAR